MLCVKSKYYRAISPLFLIIFLEKKKLLSALEKHLFYIPSHPVLPLIKHHAMTACNHFHVYKILFAVWSYLTWNMYMIHDNFLLQILRWEPDYYKSAKQLPDGMPTDLKNHISEMENNSSKFVSSET
jgi:hypothetical protein